MVWLSSLLWLMFLVVLLVAKDSVKITFGDKKMPVENPIMRVLTGIVILLVLGLLLFIVGAIFYWIGVFILLPVTALF